MVLTKQPPSTFKVCMPKTSQATLEMTIIILLRSPGLDSYIARVTTEDKVVYLCVTGSNFFAGKESEKAFSWKRVLSGLKTFVRRISTLLKI